MNHFTDIFIKRPVLSSAISFFIFLFGLIALNGMQLRLFPLVISPVISITTLYPGANGQAMNSYVTSIIEKALSGIDDTNYITASSSQDFSKIDIHMQLGADPHKALSMVMARISSISDQLPHEAEKPVITLNNSDNDPAMIIAATSHQLNRREVADYLRRAVEPILSSVDGVSQAQVLGRTQAMRLWLDPAKMFARGITASDVSDAIRDNNVLTAAGKIEGNANYFNIQTSTNLHEAQDFNNILIKSHHGAYVKLKDIANAEIGDRNSDISAFYNGDPSTMIFIKLLPNANPITVTDNIRKLLPEINHKLPFDLQLYNVVDSGRYLNEAINEVLISLFLAAIIVVATIYLFLGSFRAVLIPVITIPLSLVGVCTLLWSLHFTVNTLSLLGMVLAIGLVVDDAIVVLENIYRHIESGLSLTEASLIGAREIANPVIAMSITLAAVYVPIGLSGGLTGQLFKEFALTLSASVMISCVIALTLSPMMCNRLLSTTLLKNRLIEKIEIYCQSLSCVYSKMLAYALNHIKWMIMMWISLILFMLMLILLIPKQLAPEEDQGLLISISTTPNYTNTTYLNSYTKELMQHFNQFSASDSQVTVTGVPSMHQALSYISLKDWGKRNDSAMQLQKKLQLKVNEVPGLQTIILNPPSLPGESDLPLQIILKSNESYETLFNIANQIISDAWDSGLFNFVKSDLRYDEPALKVEINRDKAAILGISMKQISDSLSLLLGGNSIQNYVQNNQSYFVIPQIESKYRTNPEELYKIHLRSNSGKLIPLSNVIQLTKSVEMEHYNRFQKFNAITISGEMSKNHHLSDAIQFFQRSVDKYGSDHILLDYSGQTRQFIEEKNRMLWIFLAASMVIYLVLAIQFESYRLPLIILLGSAPLAVFASCLFLSFGLGTLNIYTQIGLLTLVGLISKHGILITSFATHQQAMGIGKDDAIKTACSMRFRPILMTTAAMIFGVLPLALASGAGSVSRSELGIVLVSGLLIGTILTLILLPTLYVLIAPDKKG